ncbi:MAG TPA: FmdE family protein [Bacillota bacterium]|nr:FmdE family protein [Bacillota bacterium]HUM56402.1 FmdE family protein [Bacillota bacterium]
MSVEKAYKKLTKEQLWQKCLDFHGHDCGGLTVGFKAALYAAELLDMDFSEDEEVVCIAENDACGVDSIQVILGCTAGKGNLIFKIQGKMAFNFYDRKTGKSLRLILKKRIKDKKKIPDMGGDDLFDVTPVHFPFPQKAELYDSHRCSLCGEETAEPFLLKKDGRNICMHCAEEDGRGGV